MTEWKPIKYARRDNRWVFVCSEANRAPDCVRWDGEHWINQSGTARGDYYFDYYLDNIPPIPEKPKQPNSFKEFCDKEYSHVDISDSNSHVGTLNFKLDLAIEYMELLRFNNKGE